MPHTVWNLGGQPAATRTQVRAFVAGVEPAQGVVLGRSREPKPMLLIQDAWLEVNDFDSGTEDFHQTKYSLALGANPLTTALLLPVGSIRGPGVGATNPNSIEVEQLFRAQGTIWASSLVAIDIQEAGAVVLADVDVHMDWGVGFVDWFTWFVSWNNLEVSPDGNLVDGERAYA